MCAGGSPQGEERGVELRGGLPHATAVAIRQPDGICSRQDGGTSVLLLHQHSCLAVLNSSSTKGNSIFRDIDEFVSIIKERSIECYTRQDAKKSRSQCVGVAAEE